MPRDLLALNLATGNKYVLFVTKYKKKNVNNYPSPFKKIKIQFCKKYLNYI